MKIRNLHFAAALFFLVTPALAQEGMVPVTKTDAPARVVPLRADAGLTKAEGQLFEGKYMQAVETLGGVLSRHPANADALAYIGYAWQQLGDAGKAVEFYDRALQYDPRHLGANKYKADLYLESGDFARALEQLQVIRMVCGSQDCAELDALQAEMNAFKRSGGVPAPAQKPREAPASGGVNK